MKSIEVKGTARTIAERSSEQARALKAIRKDNGVPCVLYGAGENVHFTVPAEGLRNLVYTPHIYVVDLIIDGKKVNAILKDIQFHPVKDTILHVDFYQIDETKPIVMEVPVQMEGLAEGVKAGGKLTLQMMALGWANIGAAVAPDAALASVASAIIMVLGLNGGTTDTTTAISTAIAVAIPLSVAGLFLTMICRTIAIPIVHFMDAAAEKGDFGAIERWQIVGICLQGVRIAIPAAALCFVPSSVVTGVLNAMPAWLSGGCRK